MDPTQLRYNRFIEWFFYVLAGVGFCGTWAQMPRMPYHGFIDATTGFWLDVVSRPASLFLTVDTLVLSAAVFVWMFSEARRLRIRFIWLYFLGSLFIAVSLFVPLFMGIRQRRFRVSEAATDTPLAAPDWVGVGIAVGFALAAVIYSISTTMASG